MDAMVRESRKTSMDARPRDHQHYLANTLSDYFFQLWLCFFKAIQGKISWSVALPFAINLIANLSFTPLLFGARSLIFASVDIIVVLATIIWGMTLIWRHHRWIAIAQVHYLIWVTIATYLQLAITHMNDFAA